MPWTLADVTEAQGYYLIAQADPRLAPGLDRGIGTVVVFGNILLQKKTAALTDWALVGGSGGGAILFGAGAPAAGLGAVGDTYIDTNTGAIYSKTAPAVWTLEFTPGAGGGAPVVTVDPVAPVLNQQWILHTAAVVVPGIGAVTPIPGGAYTFNIGSANPGDLIKFAVDPSNTKWAVTLQQNGGLPPGTSTFTPGPNPQGLLIQYNPAGGMTLAQLTTQINAWATANLSAGVSPIASFAPPPLGTELLTGFPPMFQINLSALSTPESYVYKIQGTAKVFQIPFT